MFHDLGERVDPSRRPARSRGGVAASRLRTTGLVTALAALALTASACGGTDATAAGESTTSARVSATAAPTSTPGETSRATPTVAPTVAPLSPFEDRAPVKAARAFSAVTARAVNDRDRALTAVVPITTARGLEQTRDYYAKDDLEHGYLQPGPEPFTPVDVEVSGATARIDLCLQTRGWSRNRATGKPVGPRTVEPIVFEMRKVGGAWKFDRYYAGTAHCAGVKVAAVRW